MCLVVGWAAGGIMLVDHCNKPVYHAITILCGVNMCTCSPERELERCLKKL